MTEYKAWGKFLISSEYLILHGAQGLAIPLLKMQQHLKISSTETHVISWQAFNESEELWFSARFTPDTLEILETTEINVATKLQALLLFIRSERPTLLSTGRSFETRMNFSSQWGLGSSSTLVSLLSQWSGVDAFHLQKMFFGGSGYDVACASATGPLLYQLTAGRPVVTFIPWNPPFKEKLSFLYLGQKQDSRAALAEFHKKKPVPAPADIQRASALTHKLLSATSLADFQGAMHAHEKLISSLLQTPPVKEHLFPDFPGEIKSLGGWGGDFVMVASDENPEAYFKKQGFNLLLKWEDLIA